MYNQRTFKFTSYTEGIPVALDKANVTVSKYEQNIVTFNIQSKSLKIWHNMSAMYRCDQVVRSLRDQER